MFFSCAPNCMKSRVFVPSVFLFGWCVYISHIWTEFVFRKLCVVCVMPVHGHGNRMWLYYWVVGYESGVDLIGKTARVFYHRLINSRTTKNQQYQQDTICFSSRLLSIFDKSKRNKNQFAYILNTATGYFSLEVCLFFCCCWGPYLV